MGTVVRNLFSLLRYELNNAEIAPEVRADITPESLKNLYIASNPHGITPLVYDALYKNGLLIENDPACESMSKCQLKAVYETEKQDYEFSDVCRIFEENKIPFIPLKGSVMRGMYPERWQRTSCDIDILVHESDLKKAAKLLVEKCQFRIESKKSHDWSLYTPSGVLFELHFDTIEKNAVAKVEKVLPEIWKHATPSDENSYMYVLDDEMLYFYHIAHMAKHFQQGGCGVRTFIDLWLLRHKTDFDPEKRKKLLSDGGILKFATAAEKLSEVWFSCADHDDLSKIMQKFVLNGCMFGKTENRVKIQQQKKGGKFKYILRRIWYPYDDIKFHYPILIKYPILLPIFEAVRWVQIIFGGGIKRSVKEISISESIPREEAEQIAFPISEIGLDNAK